MSAAPSDGVFVAPGADESFEITGATGAMLMALPDADPYFDDVARRVRALSDTPWEEHHRFDEHLSRQLSANGDAGVSFWCPCTTEAVARVLISLGPKD